MHRIAEPFSMHVIAEREGPEGLTKVPFPFRSAVAPGETKVMTQDIPRDGTVEKVTIRTYPGNQLALRVVPYVNNPRKRRRDLLQFPKDGKQWIDGDDDLWPFNMRIPVYYADKDQLVVEVTNILDPTAQNTDGTLKYPAADYTYDFAVDIEVDFAAGAWPLMAVVDHGD